MGLAGGQVVPSLCHPCTDIPQLDGSNTLSSSHDSGQVSLVVVPLEHWLRIQMLDGSSLFH